MEDTVRTQIAEIDSNYQVRVIYACESGSRAWGFPSTDSDYDVRFIYLHPTSWYLSVEDRRDVIECHLNQQLDISGWDLRKALRLFRNSNPPLFEWLGSPIVYLEKYTVIAQMRELAKTYYSPKACIYHYLHMAQGNYREYLKGEQVWIKKYFYVLRPILAINWIERGYGVAPTAFGTLVEKVVTNQSLKSVIHNLIERKRVGVELDYGPCIPEISEYIESELGRLENNKGNYLTSAAPYEALDRIFQRALSEVWLEI